MTQQNSDLLLREEYARDRTLMALDRTLLSYIRTSLTAIVVGVSFFKFFESPAMQMGGVALIIVAIFLTAFGIIRTIQSHKKISEYT
jgi:putative membrane protein